MATPIKVQSLPGIKRDGTVLEGENYIDGQWCRFQRGRPRKMGGYHAVASTVPELARGMSSFSSTGIRYLHVGGESTFTQFRVNNNGNLAGQSDRTPAALSGNANNLWQIDHFYDGAAVLTDVVAHPGQNLSNIDSDVTSDIYLGSVTGSGLLTASGLPAVSGGICTIGPYLFSYGSNGRIGWSDVNDPTTLDSEAFITQQKIVKGVPLRGSGNGPAGLFWSLDALIRATFVAGASVWQFDTIAGETSILSSQSVVEYDGVYYWLGVDRMLMFNGVVRDIPNGFNINWFFDNLNFAQRQKVFGFKVPRFGEIWWCYPRGSATECSHAIIFNVKEGYWYDTELPQARTPGNTPGRTAGIYAKVYSKPFMIDADAVSGEYTLWQHETGVDQIDGATISPIPSHFETSEIGMPTNAEAANNELRIARMEPDFVQVGDMTLNVRGRVNARAPYVQGDTFTFNDAAANGSEETVDLKEIRRLMSFKFASNAVGGNYEFGETLAHVEPAGERVRS